MKKEVYKIKYFQTEYFYFYFFRHRSKLVYYYGQGISVQLLI